MSALLRLFRSLDARAMYFRPSAESDLRPERPATLLRDLDALESDTKAKSNPFDRPLRAGALRDKLTPWQVRASARITLLGPPAASLVLLVVDYFKYWRAIAFNFVDFLAVFFLFALPAGYVFGAAPALLAALLYCALLTVNSRLRQRRPVPRACVAALCGALASGVWFSQQLRIDWGIYVLVGTLVMATLSLGTPEPAPRLPAVVPTAAGTPSQRGQERDRIILLRAARLSFLARPTQTPGEPQCPPSKR